MIFIFLDGVGIGNADADNPFFSAQTSLLPFFGEENFLPDGTPIKGIDACLGVEGIPQSATGQTTIYTGENIPALLKEHKGRFRFTPGIPPEDFELPEIAFFMKLLMEGMRRLDEEKSRSRTFAA